MISDGELRTEFPGAADWLNPYRRPAPPAVILTEIDAECLEAPPPTCEACGSEDLRTVLTAPIVVCGRCGLVMEEKTA